MSDIIETAQVYGNFIAYPILNEEGELSLDAEKYLKHYLYTPFSRKPLSPAQMVTFKKLVLALPLSERYFFIFQQKLDENGSSPALHSLLREQLSDVGPSIIRFLNLSSREIEEEDLEKLYSYDNPDLDRLLREVTSKNHPIQLGYEGILKLSYGGENALGLARFDIDNWVALIPRLGTQTIEDVDYYGMRKSRVTVSGESRLLGFAESKEKVHGVKTVFPDSMAHDEYHRKAKALIGDNVDRGIERIIQQARKVFRYKWSKDLWILRDCDFGAGLQTMACGELGAGTTEEVTRLFANTLMEDYLYNQLENCTPELSEKLTTIMFDENKQPRQLALMIVIDLVRNPEIWKNFQITATENYYKDPYPQLITLAKFLNARDVFNENMKNNILKFQCFIEYQSIKVASSLLGVLQLSLEKFNEIEKNSDQYQPYRNNNRAFLGFIIPENKRNPKSNMSNNHEALIPKLRSQSEVVASNTQSTTEFNRMKTG